MDNRAKASETNFESSLASLEQVVAQLESGDLPLERALSLFEEGVGLARLCQSQLEDAERKVEVLLRERGEIKVAPFESSSDSKDGKDSNDGKDGNGAAASSPKAAPPPTAEKSDDVIPF